jgi:hypothetical protein
MALIPARAASGFVTNAPIELIAHVAVNLYAPTAVKTRMNALRIMKGVHARCIATTAIRIIPAVRGVTIAIFNEVFEHFDPKEPCFLIVNIKATMIETYFSGFTKFLRLRYLFTGWTILLSNSSYTLSLTILVIEDIFKSHVPYVCIRMEDMHTHTCTWHMSA